MDNIILTTSNWPTSPHTIELVGWQWIIFLPIPFIIFATILLYWLLSPLIKYDT
jgi:hypothetical protein